MPNHNNNNHSHPNIPVNTDFSLRKNISKACTFCKARKRKCDGGLPCAFCRKKNRDGSCSYDIIDKRSLRYSYLKALNDAEAEERTADANNSNGNVNVNTNTNTNTNGKDIRLPSISPNIFPSQEIPIKNTFRDHVATVLGGQGVPPGVQGVQSCSTNSQQHIQSVQSVQSIQGIRNTQGTQSAQSTHSSQSSQSNQSTQLAPGVHYHNDQQFYQQLPMSSTYKSTNQIPLTPHPHEEGYSDNTDGHLTYSGPASTVNLLWKSRCLFKTLNLNGIIFSPEKYSLDLSCSSFVNRRNTHEIQDSETIVLDYSSITPLPPKQVCEIYVDLFIQNANQLIHTIDDNFLKSYIIEEAYTPSSQISNKKLAQLYMILAIGSIYMKSFQHDDNQRSYHQTVANYKNLTENYFISAIVIMNSLPRDGNLWLVEFKTLLFLYYQLINKKNTAWLTLCSAIKMAEALGLNRKKTNNAISNKEHIIHRRKLWRSLFILDRVISVSLGKPLIINDKVWDDQSSLPIEADTVGNLKSVCESQLTKVSLLIGEIYEYFSFKSKIELKDCIMLIKKLNVWVSNLPPQLKAEQIWKLDAKKEDSGRFDLLPLLLLNLFHLNATIGLSRPFFYYELTNNVDTLLSEMKSSSSANSSSSGKTTQNSQPDSPIVARFSDACFNSSIFVVKFCWYFYKNNLHPIKPYMLIDSIFNAVLIIGLKALNKSLQLIHLKHQHSNDPSFQQKWDKEMIELKHCIKILSVALLIIKDYSLLDALALRFNEIIRDMIDAILRLLKASIDSLYLNNSTTNSTTATNGHTVNPMSEFEEWLNTACAVDLETNLTDIGPEYEATIDILGYEDDILNGDEETQTRLLNEMNGLNAFLSNCEVIIDKFI